MKKNTLRSRGRPKIYPWDKWLKKGRKKLTLIRGIDFDGQAYVMAQQVRNNCYRRGIEFSSTVTEDCIVFTFYPQESE